MCSLESGILGSCIGYPTTLTETTDSITYFINDSCPNNEVLGYCFVAIENKNMEVSAFSLQMLADRGAKDCFVRALIVALAEESFATDYQFYSMIRDALERNYKHLGLQVVWEIISQIKWDPEIAKESPERTDFAENKCLRPYEV